MLPWIKRWLDWAMVDLWPFNRFGPQPQALHYSYEKAGLTLYDQPIPWNAETVVVEATMRLAPSAARRKEDFQVRLPGGVLRPADALRRIENDDRHRVIFRLPPPPATTTVELVWREHVRGQLTLPVLTRDEFVQNLRLQMPTVFVRLGQESVACQTFVSSQCKGMQADALLTSPTSLVPLLDLDLQVEFRCEGVRTAQRVPARLCSSQLAGKQALVSVVPARLVRRISTWTVTWLLGDRVLANQTVKGISMKAFQKSLRISDSRFVIQPRDGPLRVTRQAPPIADLARLGPCFLVASGEQGMAGFCPVSVHAQVNGSVQPPLLLDQQVLITDGPTMVAPGTLDAADLAQVHGFEIAVKGQSLGMISLRPAPMASFNTEGGFKPAPEFAWTSAADEELNERLARLLNDRAAR